MDETSPLYGLRQHDDAARLGNTTLREALLAAPAMIDVATSSTTLSTASSTKAQQGDLKVGEMVRF